MLKEDQLDPAYFVSAPQLAWNAHLRHIYRPITSITDPEMYQLIQPNIRGGYATQASAMPGPTIS